MAPCKVLYFMYVAYKEQKKVLFLWIKDIQVYAFMGNLVEISGAT